jgi:hypothetical protein
MIFQSVKWLFKPQFLKEHCTGKYGTGTGIVPFNGENYRYQISNFVGDFY